MGQQETLEADEVLLYSTKSSYTQETITLEGCSTMRVKKEVKEFVDNGIDTMQIVPSLYIFVPDFQTMEEVFESQAEIFGVNQSFKHDYFGVDLSCGEEEQIRLGETIENRIATVQKDMEEFPMVKSEVVARERADMYGMNSGLFLLGILLGIVFIVGAVLIMYYKQIIEGYEDQSRFEILQKVGMTRREIKQSINSQILTVFFLPLILAGVHVTFAFPLIAKLLSLFGLTNTELLIGVTLAGYLVFAFCYILVYLATSRSYYSIVSSREDV